MAAEREYVDRRCSVCGTPRLTDCPALSHGLLSPQYKDGRRDEIDLEAAMESEAHA